MKHHILRHRTLFLTAISAAVLTLTACGEKEFYNDEQYRKEFYIVSNDANIFGQEFTFGKDSTCNISVYGSGSTPVDHDVTVSLRQANSYLVKYNQSVFGSNYGYYAELLPETNYTVPNGWDVVITKNNPYTLFPVSVHIDDLSPDLSYFLPIEIAKVSDYQYSSKKNYVLMRIYMKNAYATTKTDTYYQMNGSTLELKETASGEWSHVVEGATPTAFNATKKFVPVASNAIRMLPGTSQSADVKVLMSKGLRVTVTDEDMAIDILGDDGLPTGEKKTVKRVVVDAYAVGNDFIQVREAREGVDQTTGDVLPCYYEPATKTFTLNYCYRMPTDLVDRVDSKWFKVREVIKKLSSNK